MSTISVRLNPKDKTHPKINKNEHKNIENKKEEKKIEKEKKNINENIDREDNISDKEKMRYINKSTRTFFQKFEMLLYN